MNKYPAVRVQSRLSFELTLLKWELDFTCGVEAPHAKGTYKARKRAPTCRGSSSKPRPTSWRGYFDKRSDLTFRGYFYERSNLTFIF